MSGIGSSVSITVTVHYQSHSRYRRQRLRESRNHGPAVGDHVSVYPGLEVRMNPRLALVGPRWGCHLRRTLFSLPDPFSAPFFPGSSDVQSYQEQKILPCAINRLTRCAALTARSFKPAQLYAVVADVARYPRFVPFCTGARILRVLQQHQQAVTDMEAELTVGFLSLKESYVSRVTCRPFESVKVRMVLNFPVAGAEILLPGRCVLHDAIVPDIRNKLALPSY